MFRRLGGSGKGRGGLFGQGRGKPPPRSKPLFSTDHHSSSRAHVSPDRQKTPSMQSTLASRSDIRRSSSYTRLSAELGGLSGSASSKRTYLSRRQDDERTGILHDSVTSEKGDTEDSILRKLQSEIQRQPDSIVYLYQNSGMMESPSSEEKTLVPGHASLAIVNKDSDLTDVAVSWRPRPGGERIARGTSLLHEVKKDVDATATVFLKEGYHRKISAELRDYANKMAKHPGMTVHISRLPLDRVRIPISQLMTNIEKSQDWKIYLVASSIFDTDELHVVADQVQEIADWIAQLKEAASTDPGLAQLIEKLETTDTTVLSALACTQAIINAVEGTPHALNPHITADPTVQLAVAYSLHSLSGGNDDVFTFFQQVGTLTAHSDKLILSDLAKQKAAAKAEASEEEELTSTSADAKEETPEREKDAKKPLTPRPGKS